MGRKLGIDEATETSWGTHFAFFYKGKEGLIRLAPCFFKAGLENNEFCIWVTDELQPEVAEQILTNSLPNLANYLKNKQIEIIPYADFYLQEGRFDPQVVLNRWAVKHDQTIGRGYDGLRGLVNLSWEGKGEWQKVKELEKQLHDLLYKNRLLIICAYSLEISPAYILDIFTRHQFGLVQNGDHFDIIETSWIKTNGPATGKEIISRQELETQLVLLEKMEAMGRLAGGLAHDFNNLLTIIMGEADLIKMSLSPENPLYDNIMGIMETAEKGAALTRQLLLFSRAQVVEARVIDLNVIINGLENMLRSAIGEDIDLNIILGANPLPVKGDPGRMEQVIMNLAINARDAMPQGGKLTIEAANQNITASNLCYLGIMPPGNYVRLTVTDTGVGMSPEVQTHLFEPFFTTKAPGKGTGLGLAVVFGVVRQSGGYFQVESKPGHETSFKIYLPLVEEPLEAREAEAEPHVELKGSETILEVEDDGGLRSLVSRLLRQYGYQVLEAEEGAEALLMGERHQGPIHLLLTDVVMPNMSGCELADHLATLHPEMKLLYMSGHGEKAVISCGVSEKSMPFISKPFKPADLVKKVREILDAPN